MDYISQPHYDLDGELDDPTTFLPQAPVYQAAPIYQVPIIPKSPKYKTQTDTYINDQHSNEDRLNKSYRVTFTLRKKLEVGLKIFVLGSIPELSSWDKTKPLA